MDPIVAPLNDGAASFVLGAPRIPLISNLSGTWMDETVLKPSYWGLHLRQAVRFSEGLKTLLATSGVALLEVGPGKTLATLAQLNPASASAQLITHCMSYPGGDKSDAQALRLAVGRLWCLGGEVDWPKLCAGERRCRVALPTYPFARILDRPPPPCDPQKETLHRDRIQTPKERPQYVPDSAEKELRELLQELWRELMELPSVAGHDNFFEVGGTSLLAVQFCAQLKARGIYLPVHALIQSPSIDALVKTLTQPAGNAKPKPGIAGNGSQDRPLFVCLRQGANSRPPLFLIQPIGGTVFSYLPLVEHLPSEQTVYAFRASGIEPGEPVYASVSELGERYLEELLSLQPHGPYFLGGHSSGGVIAYEMAGKLAARGAEVGFVFLADTVSGAQSQRTKLSGVDEVFRLFEPFKDIAPRTWEGFTRVLLTNSRFAEIVVKTNRALASYEPPRQRVPIVYLRAAERDTILDPHSEAFWMDLADGPFILHNSPGNHFTMMDSPHVAATARVLRQHLHTPDGEPPWSERAGLLVQKDLTSKTLTREGSHAPEHPRC
jgi:thioesterase domain-containing protein/aryl carrier-like protein